MADNDTYTVERTTTVHADPARIYREVEDFHRWQAWSPWEDLDPGMQRTYSGPEKGVGSTYAWSGNRKAGEGRMEITRADDPTRLLIDLRFVKPFKASNLITFTFAPEGDSTRVTWTLAGSKTFAVKVMGLFTSMDKMVGKDFEKGLSRLKRVAEGVADG